VLLNPLETTLTSARENCLFVSEHWIAGKYRRGVATVAH
jgi:hypothetical protein